MLASGETSASVSSGAGRVLSLHDTVRFEGVSVDMLGPLYIKTDNSNSQS